MSYFNPCYSKPLDVIHKETVETPNTVSNTNRPKARFRNYIDNNESYLKNLTDEEINDFLNEIMTY